MMLEVAGEEGTPGPHSTRNRNNLQPDSRGGGTGRRVGFKIRWGTKGPVWVQIPPPAFFFPGGVDLAKQKEGVPRDRPSFPCTYVSGKIKQGGLLIQGTLHLALPTVREGAGRQKDLPRRPDRYHPGDGRRDLPRAPHPTAPGFLSLRRNDFPPQERPHSPANQRRTRWNRFLLLSKGCRDASEYRQSVIRPFHWTLS